MNNNEMIRKINKSEKDIVKVNEQLDTKMNKDDKIKSSQLETTTNADKIKLINLSDEVQRAISGNAPALSVIPNKSITLEKIGFVTTGKNLLNKNTCTFGKMLGYNSTELTDTDSYYVSDFIEVEEGETYTCIYMYGYAYYDIEKIGISGHTATNVGSTNTITIPSGVKYIRLNIYKTRIDIMQFEKGSESTTFEDYYAYINNDYVERQPFLVDEILSKSITTQKVDFIEYGKNMYDMYKSSPKGVYVAYNNGQITSNQYTTELSYSDYIEVEVGEQYVQSGKVHSYCFFDSSKNYVSGKYSGGTTLEIDVIPSNVKYIVINTFYDYNNTVQLEKGNVATSYEEYWCNVKGAPKLPENKVLLSLPEKYELVVGDTFELFYKGILFCNNPYNYNFKITCSKGSAYSKRYIFTPNSNDVGTHTMTITVIDDNEKILDTKTVNLIVKSKATNPTSVKNVLCVGDSLIVNGKWVSEYCRRLTNTGGNPIGEGLSNIKFVGTLNGTNGAKYEGYGGWTYDHYNTNKVENQQYWIQTTANKPLTYQKSIWKDANNVQWVLETIEATRIKVYRKVSGTQMLPASGILTWVSGGDGTSDSSITYSSYVAESGNPFWNNAINKVDFLNYATNLGVETIDYCYILLGWNSTNDSETVTKDNIRTFINNLRASFLNCKITLLGLQVPSLDGFGANYGCNWNYMDKLKFVFNYNKWNLEVSKEFDNVDFINIAGQFDSENNMQTGTRQVNVRNSKTEVYGANGVHPATEGYLQIANAVYRNLSHKL